MTKYREILRLSSMGLSQVTIVVSCGVSKKSVSKTLKAVREKGLSCPLDKSYTDEALDQILFPKTTQGTSAPTVSTKSFCGWSIWRNAACRVKHR